MRHIIFQEADEYPVALLIKGSAFQAYELESRYVEALDGRIRRDQIIGFDLAYNESGKAPVRLIKQYLTEELLPELHELGTRYLYVADAAYFKVLAGQTKAEGHYGYCLPCALEGYEHMQVVLGFNYQQLVYNPSLEPRLRLTLDALAEAFEGSYKPLGADVIKQAVYPSNVGQIAQALESLHEFDTLAADIEAFSLKVTDAGVGTIGFAPDQGRGVAFPVDYRPRPQSEILAQGDNWDGLYGDFVPNEEVRSLLRAFLESYQGRLRWHNASYDLRCLIWALFMDHPKDIKGLVHGLHTMTRLFDDTKIIAYLATNSTAGNELGLKTLAHPFAGNYAVDVKDIRKVRIEDLLEYNVIDVLSTNYVYDTYYPKMVEDDQEGLYEGLMKDSLKTIIQMELVGMPLNQDKVKVARATLERDLAKQQAVLDNSQLIRQFEQRQTEEAWEADYRSRRDKAKNPDKIQHKDRQAFPYQAYNPNSGPQTQVLLYEVMNLPVLDKTDSGQPATGGKTLKKLLNHTSDPEKLEVIEALRNIAKASKILSAFIPCFEQAFRKSDGLTYLHGNFNLGGTVSGRLSANDPNLQQIPSGSDYGKLIKDCFCAPKGWVMCGADFNSLEDYISALTTKDPNKLKVYIEGYDGHSLRAFSYWPEKFPWDEMTPERSFAVKDDPILDAVRSESKGPTFALTYQGTWMTLVKNLGFDEATAKKIEAAYHELYRVSDEWVQARLDEAARKGYVEVAFGLKVRTPLLARSLRNHRMTPKEAQAEGRTAGNALGQSYGLLNNRAANEFMQRVWDSDYCYDILPIALIHDAIYLLVRDDIDIIEWVNRNLIECMEWQELPEIQHDQVKLGAALDIFWPSWKYDVTLPNRASRQEIRQLCEEHMGALEAA